MELEFQRDTLIHYQTVTDITLSQEETLESIVPDACPDILTILDVCGQAVLTDKRAQNGFAEADGAIHAAILYQPESGAGLRKMEVTLPFRCRTEAPGLTERGHVAVCPRLRAAEARVLNPRKVLIRVDLLVDVTAYEPTEITICRDTADTEDESVCRKQYKGSYYQRTAVQDKPFAFSDRIQVQGTQGESVQVLTAQAQANCTESNLIGNKLIFKGNTELSLLLQDSTGTLTTHRETLPFSQIMEIGGAGEETDCLLRTQLTSIRVDPVSDDGKDLEVTLDLLAQAEVCSHRPITVLQDLYSTDHLAEVEYQQQPIQTFTDRFVRTQSVRELVDTDDMVRGILDSRVCPGRRTAQRDGADYALEQELLLRVLYLDENEHIRCLRRTLTVSCRVPVEETAVCNCRTVIPDDVFVTPAAGGMEARFTVEFHCLLTSEPAVTAISAARIGEERGKAEGRRPSMVLRLAMPGEALWDIAKAYGTTGARIMQANDLTEEEWSQPRMLLIPGRAK